MTAPDRARTLHPAMTGVHELARAKINLDLRICRRRDDGYHDLDSLVVFADLGDHLVFSPADTLTLSIEGPFAGELSGETDNLVLRAARRLAAATGRSPDVRITLTKRLPVASGLGGGSADAAATLRGLVRLWGLSMPSSDLALLAADLGADVPVCLASTPAGMRGIGDCLAPFELKEPLPMLLVNPGKAVATAGVFNALSDMSGERRMTMDGADNDALKAHVKDSVNDLEVPARQCAPVIDDVLRAMESQPGCELARMSGSGATCFGLFDQPDRIGQAQRHLQAAHPDWWVVQTICRSSPCRRFPAEGSSDQPGSEGLADPPG